MLDREKIIKGLQIERECVSRDCDRNCGNCDLVQERDWLLSVYDDAIDLLKEQEPQQVVITTISTGLKYFHCPRCNHDLYAYPRQRYCSNCGQAIKWN